MVMKSVRLQQMEQFILGNESVSMDRLCEKFEISMNTARLDVAQLVKKGSVRKVYGGVCSAYISTQQQPFAQRKFKNLAQKKAIGLEAEKYVEDRDIIFIDSGSTALQVINAIGPQKSVTILTNSLEAVNSALIYENIEVICLPGKLERRINAFIGIETAQTLRRYNIRKAFFGAAGITPDGDISDFSLPELEIKQAAIHDFTQTFLLVDSSKYNRTSLITYFSISQFSRVVTDSDAGEGFLHMCSMNGVPVDLAEYQGK